VLLAILWCRGGKHQTATALAKKRLNGFGNLTRLLEAEPEPVRHQMGRITVPYVD